MMYGMSLPIVFPITLFAILNLYVMDKLMLTYYYRRPPNFDLKISKRALKFLRYPTFVGLIFAYWVVGN